jgi:hypothetical protein
MLTQNFTALGDQFIDYAFMHEDIVIPGPRSVGMLVPITNENFDETLMDDVWQVMRFVPRYGPGSGLAGTRLDACIQGAAAPNDVNTYLLSWWSSITPSKIAGFLTRYVSGMPGGAASVKRMRLLKNRDVPSFINKVMRHASAAPIALSRGRQSKPAYNADGLNWYAHLPKCDGFAIEEDASEDFPNCPYPTSLRAKIGQTHAAALMQYTMGITVYDSAIFQKVSMLEEDPHRHMLTENLFLAAIYQAWWYELGYSASTLLSSLREENNSDMEIGARIKMTYSSSTGTSGGEHTPYYEHFESIAQEWFGVDLDSTVFDNIYFEPTTVTLFAAPILTDYAGGIYNVSTWWDGIPTLIPDSMMEMMSAPSQIFNSYEAPRDVGSRLHGMGADPEYKKIYYGTAADYQAAPLREQMEGYQLGVKNIYGAGSGTVSAISARWSASMLVKAVMQQLEESASATWYIRTLNSGDRMSITVVGGHPYFSAERVGVDTGHVPTSIVINGNTFTSPNVTTAQNWLVYDHVGIYEYSGSTKRGTAIVMPDGEQIIRLLNRRGVAYPKWSITEQKGVSASVPIEDREPGIIAKFMGKSRRDKVGDKFFSNIDPNQATDPVTQKQVKIDQDPGTKEGVQTDLQKNQ